MMSRLTGKGVWTWQLRNTEGGPGTSDAARGAAVASQAKAARLAYVTVKVSDGTDSYQAGSLLRAVVNPLREAGIASWAWGYSYGRSPATALREGILLGQRAAGLGVAGVILDVEGEYEAGGGADWAKSACRGVRLTFGGPLAFSSFWKPSVHADFPWHTFCALTDLVMPQVYPFKRDAGLTAQQCFAEFAPYLREYPALQLVPTGAIAADECDRNPAKVTHFCEEVDAARLGGANFWDWQNSVESAWEAMARWDPIVG